MTDASTSLQPRRVLVLDIARRTIEYPDPRADRTLPMARMIVRRDGAVLESLDVIGSDEELLHMAGAYPGTTGDMQISASTKQQGFASPHPLVTVAIASYRNVESTIACVRQVLRQTWPTLDVIVVDNDAGADTLAREMATAFEHDPRVRCINEPRQGLSWARNAGLAAARGEFIAFTDDDVLVDSTWVEHLIAAFAIAEDVQCVTGSILPIELSTPAQLLLEEYGGFNKGFRQKVFDGSTNEGSPGLYPFTAGQFGSGANMAFRTSYLRGIHGFAVDLGAGTPAHGGEDLEVLRRVIASGRRLVYEPNAIVWHRHRRDMRALRRQMFRYGIGLSATITKWLVTDRSLALQVMRRLPKAVDYLLNPSSQKNRAKSTSFPRLLTYLELAGIMLGPLAFARSCWRTRRLRRLHVVPTQASSGRAA